MSGTIINDPLFSQQWYLLNTGQNGGTPGVDLNVLPVWNDYTGKGITVAVVDQGVEYAHPDLAANVNTFISFSGSINGNDGQPVTSDDSHGVAVAGEIAAVAGNGIGGVGVAFDATLASVYIDLSETASDADLNAGFTAVLTQAVNSYDVINNSWGYGGVFHNFNDIANQGVSEALTNAVTYGRDGLGVVVVFAAGNDREKDYDANADNLTNSPYTIAVAAIDNAGKVSSYSTPGASILVAAPSSSDYYTLETTVIPAANEDEEDQIVQKLVPHTYGEVVTSDRVGENGYNTAPSPQGDYAYDFGGTSAAAPQVAGVVALMLEANPELGYRDVQDILALTARNTDASGSWAINGATTWNGGGMHTSRDVGYGLVDATAAVRLAETWDAQSTTANLMTYTGEAHAQSTLGDGTGSASSSITLPAGISVERAEVVLDLNDADASDLVIVLTSPSGTRSTLFDAAGLNVAYPANFAMTSTQYLGESSQGVWTITVLDTKADGSSASFGGWKLNLYGSAATDDTRYVYTNEYSSAFAQDSSRALVVDTSGTDTLNMSPVTAGAAIDLQPSTVSLVAGAPLVIAPFTVIENVYTGDGNDLIVDNSVGNKISAGRGNDILMTTFGNDILDGGSGFDVVGFDRNYDAYLVEASDGVISVSSMQGTKSITNIEALSFADRVVSSEELLTSKTAFSTASSLATGIS
ncbi:MAG: regulatory P domain of subtilisin-like proprotein convertase [Solidesulfovibrio magneticus str. Maddingley MBC34]|uniref:Regulatory P domain of subtilisin-like proprotein convertase n=1 Tax=Solidesulfovibrio magneticus str. Maddingley MBC34 TaxID=1206767 RepID=K6GSC9_9BACT|nr:MAG: regulatory P domain of subtilisin-like proprotein convertase [Solidesulfovibrio magneticus str. Maddingley MBC34]